VGRDTDGATGHVLVLAGKSAEALPYLRRQVGGCFAATAVFPDVRAQLDLAHALRDTGDVKGACQAYAAVVAQWGYATPPSLSAEAAREQFGPEGAGPPSHTHDWDEAYFMIDGEMDVRIGDRVVVLKPGGFVHLRAGTPHCFRYRSGNGRFLSVTSRGGAAAFFGDLARSLPDGSPDIPKVVAVAERHGVRLAGPPPA